MNERIVAKRLSLAEVEALARGSKPKLKLENPPKEDNFYSYGKVAASEEGIELSADADRETPSSKKMLGVEGEPKNKHPELEVTEKKITKKPTPVLLDRPLERQTYNSGAKYERLDLPSRCLFYNWSTIEIRRLTFDDLMLLNRALQRSDTTLLIDALGNTITQDIRELTIPDFRYVMFWHRLNSYIKSPYRVNYTSKYGNKIEVEITKSTLEEKKLDLPLERLAEWKAKGMDVPRMRDVEVVETAVLDDDQRFAHDRAQWLSLNGLEERVEELRASKDEVPTITARIEKLASLSLETLEDIRDFRSEVGDYGVVEKVKVTDNKFKPEVWIESLKSELSTLESTLASLGNKDSLAASIDIIRAEITSMENRIANGEIIKPDEEEVTLSFNAWSLFPDV